MMNRLREKALCAANPDSHLHSVAVRRILSRRRGLDNGNFGLISRGPLMATTPKLSAVLLTLVFLWCRGAQAQESLEVLQKRAEKGSPEAQTVLGTIYRNGQGVRQDLGEAVRWFRQAAAQGYAEAENSLGFLYDYG